MKVYKSVCTEQFGGGAILIAANSSDEALAVLAADDRYNWVCEWNEDYNDMERLNDGFSPFHVFDGLEYDCIQPCVILFSFYRE